MALLTEPKRITDVLLYQAGIDYSYVTDQITVVSGAPAPSVGMVLGKITASGKFTQLNLSASDGSQNAAAVCTEATPSSLGTTLSADAVSNAITRGPAIVKQSGLVYPSGITGTQITAALVQLIALAITNRQDFGV